MLERKVGGTRQLVRPSVLPPVESSPAWHESVEPARESRGPAEPGPRIIDSEGCRARAREDAVCPTVQEWRLHRGLAVSAPLLLGVLLFLGPVLLGRP